MAKEDKRALLLPDGRSVSEAVAGFDLFSEALDSKFRVGGVKFGADSLIGLVPVAGDVLTGVAGLYALGTAWRHRLPLSASIHILWNIGFDMTLGAVPVAGDVFDFFNRSNRKNFRVVEKHLVRRAEAHAKSLKAPAS
ncbi:MAG: DUF4112 domain-containing protein [Hyphomonas sp.]|uniref:DUF4112 domain-containing protein n=1 Tax=Hyphomonas sp. TaxID=87 RepID=UPI0035270420